MSSSLFKTINFNRAKVYKNASSSTQSGRQNAEYWILEPVVDKISMRDSIMGWPGCSDVKKQIKLKFSTLGDVERYAKKNRIIINIIKPKEKSKIIKSYADNFK